MRQIRAMPSEDSSPTQASALTGAPQNALPPELIRYSEKIKARLAIAIFASLMALSVLWTIFKPQLPPEMIGIIIGSLTTAIGGITQAYWGVMPNANQPPRVGAHDAEQPQQ